MTLETLTPDANWDAADHEDAVETLGALADEISIIVWGRDNCGDCIDQLPALGAAFEAAGVDEKKIEAIPVDDNKQGPKVVAYDVEYIPTVVIERDGEEIARFVESAPEPAIEVLADQIAETVESV